MPSATSVLLAAKLEKKKESKEVMCYWCEEKGHKKRDCANFKSRKETNLTACMLAGRESSNWVVDSGASYHIISDIKLLEGYEEFQKKF